MANTRVAVVVPVYNEQRALPQTLEALVGQTTQPGLVVVVDNGSTDGTAEVIRQFEEAHRFIRGIREPRKGTGYACNTGFRYAIDTGKADVIARTDGDTVPSQEWVAVISEFFATYPHKIALTGPNPARTDDGFYRWYDKYLHRFIWGGMGWIASKVYRDEWTRAAMPGHNMAVRREAYEAVGGFPNTAIDEADEDIVLSRALYERYGLDAFGYDKRVAVATSMRRMRAIGYWRVPRYYGLVSQTYRLKVTNNNVDIR